jgi:hypothetical protein
MNSQHTPGPWSLDHGSAFDTDNQPLPGFAVGSAELGFTTVTIRAVGQTLTPCPSVDKLREIGLANARLIAAAPELLEALQGALAIICTPSTNAERAEVINLAIAAINKAQPPC